MRQTILTIATVGLLAACVPVGGADGADEVALAPTFAPLSEQSSPPEDPASTAPAPTTKSPGVAPSTTVSETPPPAATTAEEPVDVPATPADPTPSAGATAPPATAPPTGTPSATPPPTRTPAGPADGDATVTDDPSDRTTTLEPSPDWADLAGATLSRREGRMSLAIAFGEPAPTAAPDGDHTMNVVSFYDVDGDGSIDYEIYANLADGGWDSGYFDNVSGGGGFADGDPITIAVEGDRLVVTFPASAIGATETFRWSLASEYGRYEQVGTALMARDDAPNDDRPADFPG